MLDKISLVPGLLFDFLQRNHKSGQRWGLIHHVIDIGWMQGEHTTCIGGVLISNMYAPSLKASFLLVKLTSLDCVNIWSRLHTGRAPKHLQMCHSHDK